MGDLCNRGHRSVSFADDGLERDSTAGWWRVQARIASMGGAVLFLVLEMYEVDQKYGTKKERLFIDVHAGVELQ